LKATPYNCLVKRACAQIFHGDLAALAAFFIKPLSVKVIVLLVAS